jgi:cobalt transporter subunit CbtB
MIYSQNLVNSVRKKATDITLSVPVQATLFLSLSALTIWTVYLSPYPAVHNSLHHLRHSTAAVGCH